MVWRIRTSFRPALTLHTHVAACRRRIVTEEVEEEEECLRPIKGSKRKRRNDRRTMLARAFSSILLISGVTLAQFRCPEPKGFFPDPEQCDLYFACVDGKAEEKLCKDGLVFRDDNPKKELCDIPANVPCGDRTLLRKLQYFPIFCRIFF